jgi:hypothetical protein
MIFRDGALRDINEYNARRADLIALHKEWSTKVRDYGKGLRQINVDELARLLLVTQLTEEEAKKRVEGEVRLHKIRCKMWIQSIKGFRKAWKQFKARQSEAKMMH